MVSNWTGLVLCFVCVVGGEWVGGYLTVCLGLGIWVDDFHCIPLFLFPFLDVYWSLLITGRKGFPRGA